MPKNSLISFREDFSAFLAGALTRVQVFLGKAVHNFIKNSKITLYWTGVLIVGLGIAVAIFYVFNVPLVYAEDSKGFGYIIVQLFGNMFYWVIAAPFGLMATVMAFVLTFVATYPYGTYWQALGLATSGGFIKVPAVVTGWKLVRDMCNVFFSLILLVIALATVLKIETFAWKKLLPQFVLMAILINFSRSICGVFTDIATVAMATFGGSFGNIMGASLLGAFGMPDVLTLNTSNVGSGSIENKAAGDTSWSWLLLGYIMTALMFVLLFVILTVFTLLLIFRIVILWFLIVISPLAYITRILPQTQKYAQRWWEMFSRWCVVGPLITFFLWISLSIAFGTNVDSGYNGAPLNVAFEQNSMDKVANMQGPVDPSTNSTFQAPRPNTVVNFMIMMLMLAASLKLSLEMAAEVGGILGKAQGVAMLGVGMMAAKASRLVTGVSMGASEKLAKWRQKISNDEDGKPKPMGTGAKIGSGILSTFSGLTSGTALIANAAFQPKRYAKNLWEGIQKNEAAAQAKQDSAMASYAEGLRNTQVTGQGAGVLGHGRVLTTRLAGVLSGMGNEDAQEVWKYNNPLSWDVAKTKAARVWNAAGSMTGLGGPRVEKEKLEEQVAKEKGAQELMEYHNAIKDSKNNRNDPSGKGDFDKAAGALQIDVKIPAIKAVIEARAQDLTKQANAVGASSQAGKTLTDRADRLKSFAEQENPISLAQLVADDAGGDETVDLFQGQLDSSLADFKDAGKHPDHKFFNPSTNTYEKDQGKLKKDLGQDAKAKEMRIKKLKAKLDALETGPSEINQLKARGAVNEEYEKLNQYLKTADQQEEELLGALEQKKWNKVNAVLRIMQENGNLDRASKNIVNMDNPGEGGNSAVGMKAFLKHQLIGKGMGKQQAYSMMNSIMGPASSNQGDFAGHFSYDKRTGFSLNDPEKARGIQDFIMERKKFLEIGQMDWTTEDADGKEMFADYAQKAFFENAGLIAKDEKLVNNISLANRKFVVKHYDEILTASKSNPVVEKALNHIRDRS